MNRQIPFRKPQGWKWTILVVLSLCLALPLLPVQAQVSSKHVPDSHRIIIKFRPGSELLKLARKQSASLSRPQTSRDLSSIQSALGIKRLRPLKLDATLDPLPGGVERIFIASLADSVDAREAIATARGLKEIEYAESVSPAGEAATGIEEGLEVQVSEETSGFPSDPYFPKQWALRNTGDNSGKLLGKRGVDLGMLPAWAITTGSRDITVAFLSSGLRADAFDFLGRVSRNGYNFFDSNYDLTDDISFGTFVAGVTAASGNNSYSIAGVDWKCSILPIKISGPLMSQWQPTADRLAGAIVYAADNKSNVICIPLIHFSESSAVTDAVTYASSRNCILVAGFSSGWTLSSFSYASTYPGVIFVGSVDSRGARYGSAYGRVDFMAPGKEIHGTSHTYPYGSNILSGPYPACALAAGVISLMLSLDRGLTRQEVYDILKESAVDQEGPDYEDTPGWDQYHGWGRINAYRALRIIQERTKAVPEAFGVSQNYPNPFNSGTVIQYELRYPMHVSIKIYNVLGQPVVTLLDEEKQAGYHHVRWDANVASGMYIYRLEARLPSGSEVGKRVIVKKMLLVK